MNLLKINSTEIISPLEVPVFIQNFQLNLSLRLPYLGVN